MDLSYSFEICRLCLIKSNNNFDTKMKNIFEYEGNIIEKIQKCTALQIVKGDQLPENICLNCLDAIVQFYSFREMCWKSDRFLQKQSNNQLQIADNRIVDSKNTILKVHNELKLHDCDDEHNSECGNNEDCKEEYASDDKIENNFPIKGYSSYNEKKDKIYKVDDSMKEIIGENQYICDICLCNFDLFIEYYDHQEVHNGAPVFKCSKCSEVFSYRKDLVEHDSHHKIPCPMCNLQVLPRSMTAHLLIHTDVHKCSECGMRHTSNAALEKHIKARHAGIKGFVCHICGKQSSCQSSMNRHMAYHRDERPYKCKYCDFCAKSLNIVQVHTSRKHFAEKCVCEICAKIFKSQPSLVQHMKRIHTSKKHVCLICSKAFIEKYNLGRHLKKHIGQRLHECKICNTEFFTVRKLKEHMHSHRQGCVNCPKCGKEFFYKKYFNKHVLKCNNNSSNSENVKNDETLFSSNIGNCK